MNRKRSLGENNVTTTSTKKNKSHIIEETLIYRKEITISKSAGKNIQIITKFRKSTNAIYSIKKIKNSSMEYKIKYYDNGNVKKRLIPRKEKVHIIKYGPAGNIEKNYVRKTQNGNVNKDGIFSFIIGRPHIREYRGQLQNNQPLGECELLYVSDDKYEGETKDNNFHGKGCYSRANGTKFEGNFKDGRRDGKFSVIYPDGKKEEVEYENGKLKN